MKKWPIILGAALIVVAVIMAVNLFTPSVDRLNFYDADYPSYMEDITGEVKPIEKSEYNYEEIVAATDGRGLIFPESSEGFGGAKLFFYTKECVTNVGRQHRSEIFLSVTYDEQTYNAECERLKCVKNAATDKATIYGENLFSLPACVAAYNDVGLYEYALFDAGARTVHYIYLKCMCDSKGSVSANLVFDKALFPQKALTKSDVDKAVIVNGAYSIYS